ncbi:carbamoyltransferase C-terminal domain-containing protein [Aquimarina sp. RZ0]|uniref:carbamoyltransferase family protein n=1 Tax=Aquimarina sp. RZ0 TaxID=2607730 RepID=UPI0011F24182|nr:carbamoyltransferase C-terminal domain-containing protein [Aquimarina sp. RZ0]KAA1243796.1 nodulation protein nolNO [Aquimarina sp. RZ0]
MKKYYIGIACTFHDPSIVIIDMDGEILFAEASERYLQNKRAFVSPADDMFRITYLLKKYCSSNASYTLCFTWSKTYIDQFVNSNESNQSDEIKPLQYPDISGPFENLTTYNWSNETEQAIFANLGTNTVRALREDFSPIEIKKEYFDHHLCHAAYACYSSPFDSGICVILDGIGENGPISIYRYENGQISLLDDQKSSASIGFLYSSITQLCGYNALKGEEWKIMGLAPYGKLNRELYLLLEQMLSVDNCVLKYSSSTGYGKCLKEMFEKHKPNTESEIADIAFTGQKFFSELVTTLLNNVYTHNKSENLIYSGGCALNSSFNGTILKNTGFKSLHIPSAPGDDGNAIGAALLSYKQDYSLPIAKYKMLTPYLGSSINKKTVESFLKHIKLENVRELSDDKLFSYVAEKLAEGKLVSWIQGRAEFGPRALGNRSILADPRDIEMKDKINSVVKYREGYRPFAPAILNDFGNTYFHDYRESRYMELTGKFKMEQTKKVPAVVHINHTGRYQSVKEEWNERFYKLIKAFYDNTNVPVLLNTSCNVMGKPMVHSLEDALGMFFTNGLDILVIDNVIVEKSESN